MYKYLGVIDRLFSWKDHTELFLREDKTKYLFSLILELVLYFEMKIYLKLYYFINNIVSDPNRVLNSEHRPSPSNLRYRGPRCNRIRLKHSFVHQSVLKLNMKLHPISDLR